MKNCKRLLIKHLTLVSISIGVFLGIIIYFGVIYHTAQRYNYHLIAQIILISIVVTWSIFQIVFNK